MAGMLPRDQSPLRPAALLVLLVTAAASADTMLAEQILGRSVGVRDGYLRVDGRTITTDVPPVGDGQNVFVPLRFLFEAVGGAVSYDAAHRQISIASFDRQLRFRLGEKEFEMDGERFSLPVAPFSYGGRTMVPWKLVQKSSSPRPAPEPYSQAKTKAPPATWSWPPMSFPQRLRHVFWDQRLVEQNRLVAPATLLLWAASAFLFVWQSLVRRGERG